MQYQALFNSIKRGVLAPVYLFYGPEDYLIEMAVEELKKLLIDPGVGAFNFDEIDGERASAVQIVESCITLPVFSSKRLVIVKDFPLQQEKNNTAEDSYAPQDKVLFDYLKAPAATTCLVFVLKGTLDKRKKLFKAVEKVGASVEFNRLKGQELADWLNREARLYDKVLLPEALEYIIFNSNHNLRFLKNELEKMALYAGKENKITLGLAQKLLTRTGEASIFVFVDSLGLKKPGPALREMQGLLQSGEPPARILFMIARQFRLLLFAKELAHRGYTGKQLASELSQPSFVVAKILSQSKNFSFPELEKSLQLILDTDIAIKTGTPAAFGLERLTISLAADLSA